jgi:hypothetical protein
LGRVSFGENRDAAFQAFLQCLSLVVSYFPDVARYAQGELPGDVDGKLAAYRETYQQTREKANKERESIAVEDELVSVDLGDDLKRAIKEHAALFPEIKQLFVVEKRVQHFQHDRVFLLGFDVNSWHDNVEADESKWLQRASDSFAERFPGLNKPFATLVSKKSRWPARLAEINGALVYEGSGKSKRTTWQQLKLGYWLIVLVGVLVVIFARSA